MQVFKFGGASVKDAASVKNVAHILEKYVKEPTVVVVSAMGKTTNLLEDLVKAFYYGNDSVPGILEQLRSQHMKVVDELFPGGNKKLKDDLANIFVELQWATEGERELEFDQLYDQVVSQGEMLSTRIVAAWLKESGLNNEWLDVRGVLRTDNTYREGRVDFLTSAALVKDALLPLFGNCELVVTQGFLGGTSENYTTTLGREGSDYTAALLAYFTDASQVVIWKDVPGLLNADPKYFSNTSKIDELSYHDAIELTYYGASVIHPRTMKPLQNKSIPLHVRSFLEPDKPGTVIRGNETRLHVPSYIFKEHQILISIQPKDFAFITEDAMSEIFSQLSKFHVRVNMMQNSALSFSICVDDDRLRIAPLMEVLKTNYNILYNDGVCLMTIRNYSTEIIDRFTKGRTILLEQRSRSTFQFVIRQGHQPTVATL